MGAGAGVGSAVVVVVGWKGLKATCGMRGCVVLWSDLLVRWDERVGCG